MCLRFYSILTYLYSPPRFVHPPKGRFVSPEANLANDADRPAPRFGRVRLRDQEWEIPRHVDGVDAAGWVTGRYEERERGSEYDISLSG